MNFDGASRGNPGPGGAGGIFRDAQGEIVSLYTIRLGHTTNNGAELVGFLAGLQMAKELGYSVIIAEGDSQVLVYALGKIINRASSNKVSKNCDFLQGFGGGSGHP
jgi:ribonuclease HI